MKLEQYNQLKKVIQEANPKIMENIYKNVCCRCNKELSFLENSKSYCGKCGEYIIAKSIYNGKKIKRKITLSNILITLEDKLEGDYINEGGEIEFIVDDGESWTWNLKDDNLDNQSDETKKYLYKLLVK